MTKKKPKTERRITPDRRQTTRNGRRTMEEKDEERQLRVTQLIDDLLQQQSKWPVTNASQAGDGIRAVTDDDGSQPHRPPAPPTQPAPGEPLFEFKIGDDRILCELRDYGEPYGVEAQFFRNEVFEIGRRFDGTMDPTRPPRDLAIAWAEEWRKAMESHD